MDALRPARRARSLGFEQLEPRFVLSADPLTLPAAPAFSAAPALEPALLEAHQQTGLNAARADYGLTGAGQTVVVVDTGIASDHPALEGSFVGGYDFFDGDSNPYDDGPRGGHGTHIAGIIAAQDEQNPGLAPGVDLVMLRIHDGGSRPDMALLEEALAWVHDHRNDFANPVTTVSLSFGAPWNSEQIPDWAVLEEELSQLQHDGIFIAVAAGNNFPQYHEPGLSYPAASPHVVPVGALNMHGELSGFSQRSTAMIVAPGHITSTVPDYRGNQDGLTNDWATWSGTSMATPYVAGASVLIREAMTQAGRTGIDQDAIYQVMRETADPLFDAETGETYLSLNVERAIDSILGGAAISAPPATPTPSPTPSPEPPTPALDPQPPALSNPAPALTTPDAPASSVSSLIGATDLGRVEFREQQLQANQETWYQATAAREGTFTVEVLFSDAQGDLNLEVFDANQSPLAASQTTADAERVDLDVSAGDTLLIKVTGTNPTASLRLANLVHETSTKISVFGTESADRIHHQSAAGERLDVNGVTYRFDASSATEVEMLAGGGDDTVRVQNAPSRFHFRIAGGPGDDTLTGGFGNDVIEGNEGNDTLRGRMGHDILRGGPGDDSLFGGKRADALLGGAGEDRLVGRRGHDLLVGGEDSDRLQGKRGRDMLIGDASVHDARDQALLEMLHEWRLHRRQVFESPAVSRSSVLALEDVAILSDGADDELLDFNPRHDWRRAA